MIDKLIYEGLGVVGASVAAGKASYKNRPGRAAGNARDIHPLLTGMRVPAVTFKDLDEKKTELYSLLGRGPTVLVFYRGGWCPYCNTQLSQLHEIEDEVLKSGFQIIAASADKPASLKKSIEKHSMRFTLLSDNTTEGAQAFGIAFEVDEEGLARGRSHGVSIEEASGYGHHILPVPAVFLVDKEGTIMFEYVNPDYHIRLDGKVLLAIVKAWNHQTEAGPEKK